MITEVLSRLATFHNDRQQDIRAPIPDVFLAGLVIKFIDQYR